MLACFSNCAWNLAACAWSSTSSVPAVSSAATARAPLPPTCVACERRRWRRSPATRSSSRLALPARFFTASRSCRAASSSRCTRWRCARNFSLCAASRGVGPALSRSALSAASSPREPRGLELRRAELDDEPRGVLPIERGRRFRGVFRPLGERLRPRRPRGGVLLGTTPRVETPRQDAPRASPRRLPPRSSVSASAPRTPGATSPAPTRRSRAQAYRARRTAGTGSRSDQGRPAPPRSGATRPSRRRSAPTARRWARPRPRRATPRTRPRSSAATPPRASRRRRGASSAPSTAGAPPRDGRVGRRGRAARRGGPSFAESVPSGMPGNRFSFRAPAAPAADRTPDFPPSALASSGVDAASSYTDPPATETSPKALRASSSSRRSVSSSRAAASRAAASLAFPAATPLE